MAKKFDLYPGVKIGLLTIVGKAPSTERHGRSYVKCDCGSETFIVTNFHLREGSTKSCGCIVNKKVKRGEEWKDNLHGHSRSGGTYTTWCCMKSRCDYEGDKEYEFYGGRGISYDPQWKDFNKFLEDMGERPEGKTLDRIDTNKNYSKENCRWATSSEQNKNKRSKNLIYLQTIFK